MDLVEAKDSGAAGGCRQLAVHPAVVETLRLLFDGFRAPGPAQTLSSIILNKEYYQILFVFGPGEGRAQSLSSIRILKEIY